MNKANKYHFSPILFFLKVTNEKKIIESKETEHMVFFQRKVVLYILAIVNY